MENIFIEFLPPWIETGLQPAFYDKESGTVLQQTARMYAKVNEVVGTVNHQNEEIADYVEQFNELHDYVHDYFDNLDVQEEIDHKLDELVNNGQFQIILAQYVNPYITAQNEEINAFKATVNAQLTVQDSKINGLQFGTPIPVTSTSYMTDETKIYVNTTDGKWYYYDGDSWEIGGTYQSAGIGENSVGIGNLNANLQDILNIDIYNDDDQFDWEQGIIGGNGVPGTDTSHAYWNNTIRTPDFLTAPDYFEIHKTTGPANADQFIVYIFFYDADEHFISSTYQGAGAYDVATAFLDVKSEYPSAKYYKVTIRRRTTTFNPSDYDGDAVYYYTANKNPEVTIPDSYVVSTPDNLVSLPSLTFGEDSYLSGQTLVKDLFISFGVTDDEHENYKQAHVFKINETTKEYTLVKTILHNFGHVNSVDYCEETDTLIFGNGSGSYTQYGKFYIYKNFYTKLSDSATTQLNIDDPDILEYDCSGTPFYTEPKWNVIWFDSNRDQYDLALLVTNDLAKFRVLQLGTGTNHFEYGDYQASNTGVFNGSFKVIEEYDFDPSDTNDHVLQDMDYQSGVLYCGVSHNYPYYWTFTFDRKNHTLNRNIIPVYSIGTDGVDKIKSVGAICCNDKWIILNTGLIIVKPLPVSLEMQGGGSTIASTQINKKLAIYGDSISTYAGYIPDGNATYYTGSNAGVTNVNQTWWKEVVDALGYNLLVNNSWSGRAVSSIRDSWTGHTTDAGYKQDNIDVLGSNGTPDVIIIKLGINDFNSDCYLGDYTGTTELPETVTTFSDAYAVMLQRIQTTYPLAKIYCCTLMSCERSGSTGFPEINGNNESIGEWNERIRLLANAFGCSVLDHNSCGITYNNLSEYMGDYNSGTGQGLHPNYKGMALIANETIHEIDNAVRVRY